ncbi:MAG: 23S rRNA (pseudouridine(1915)-N(3))-methyltransferase RlmH [Ruminococcaceae bacterium]|nr:23S rRNA (pseudouridine(1915)-N(3))-methyltransferase RlmH [Oscillospiraceae bacterium]
MIGVTIIALGKLKEKYLRDACDEYIKRLSALCKLKIVELEPVRLSDNASQTEIDKALDKEAKEILSRVSSNSKVIAMCIEGKQMPSEKLSSFFEETAVSGCGDITFVIGSSYGMSNEVKKRADVRLSMSEMTFPHQLARVMLLEQIYRAFMISNSSKYHK